MSRSKDIICDICKEVCEFETYYNPTKGMYADVSTKYFLRGQRHEGVIKTSDDEYDTCPDCTSDLILQWAKEITDYNDKVGK